MGGKTVVITGASDGIGAATARQLHDQGENVVVVGRSEGKTTAVAAELGADYFVADFADLSRVRGLAEKIHSDYESIDVLVNNAGGMPAKTRRTADGYDMTYQVNYLAPFLLTTLLLDVLVDSRATIVNTCSAAHKMLRNVSVDDIERTERRRPIIAYALSKFAIVLFTRELHRRYHGGGLAVAAVHPGYVNTNFGRASGSRLLAVMAHTPVPRLVATADRAARQLVWLASSTPGDDWQSGEYYSRNRIAKANCRAYDPSLARELWDRTQANLSR
ncbi:SDR family NAD(P)-dependent oxidoreductase [Mycobacterium spongiae]|uniref:SDR family NAD(P)-dependent oxidoreductase n=1 Tax=Mycobacterium spongiae TaxID=886343 RepID=A0A975PXP2_9MYCO|nr:SDR family NAD(P)-dependent oxidoreductase [Mycobacterium spongiae]QUR68395.1 SDR family NAD(P)-dependent oxidoreductase [Mycobacterium spongiae]